MPICRELWTREEKRSAARCRDPVVPREEGSEERLSDMPYMNSTGLVDNSVVHMGGMRWAQRHSVNAVRSTGRARKARVHRGATNKKRAPTEVGAR